MIRRMIVFSGVLLLTCSSRAVLPPDAKAREPDIRAYRQQLNLRYEERQVERQAAAVRAYEQTRLDIMTPPWMRTGVHPAAPAAEDPSVAETAEARKRNHRFLISIVLLILIGGGAVWVRRATREVDDR